VDQGEKLEAKSSQIRVDLRRDALRRERRAESRPFGQFFDRIVILSGPNHTLNHRITLGRARESGIADIPVPTAPLIAIALGPSPPRFSGQSRIIIL
jgi:hypothetical protein